MNRDVILFGAGAGVVALIALYFAGRGAVKIAGDVAGALNPVSDQNIFYRATNAVGGAVAGDESFSLGSWIYDLTHPEPPAITDAEAELYRSPEYNRELSRVYYTK